jgi:hypothetical protein
MLHHPLKELVEYVGCDGDEYVGKRKGCPKRMEDRLEACFLAC